MFDHTHKRTHTHGNKHTHPLKERNISKGGTWKMLPRKYLTFFNSKISRIWHFHPKIKSKNHYKWKKLRFFVCLLTLDYLLAFVCMLLENINSKISLTTKILLTMLKKNNVQTCTWTFKENKQGFFARRHHHCLLVTLKSKTLIAKNVRLKILNVFFHVHLNVLNLVLLQLIYWPYKHHIQSKDNYSTLFHDNCSY